jgi:hypothetical protein
VRLDNAVAAAYGWGHSELGHGFRETKQGIRYTISDSARREILDRLLKLNQDRHAEEQVVELAAASTPKRGRRPKGSGSQIILDL